MRHTKLYSIMSQYFFVENAKKSRRKALLMTIMFHVVIIGGVIFASPSALSDLQLQFEEWIDKASEDEPVSMI